MEELRDIKPLLEIPDSSYIIFVLLVIFIVSIVVILLFLLFRKIWKKRELNREELYFERLKNVDWNNSKEAAYTVTRLGKILTRDEEKASEIYEKMLLLLVQYKYKKEVPEVDEETLTHYNLLVHIIDESL